MRMSANKLAAVALSAAMLVAACGDDDKEPTTPAAPTGGTSAAAVSGDVEVFTWWAEGGEKAGLDGMVEQFKKDCSGANFVNGAVAGGAGANAKQVLASRLQQGDPPSTFQAHAGAELNDYIAAGQVEDISALYTEWGLDKALPKGLIDSITKDGKIYSVPANIHRGNVLWSNKKVVADAGVAEKVESLDDFFKALDTVKSKGVATPLAIGRDWTQVMLLESVLISELGPDKYNGLWDGSTDWKSAEVTKGIETYKKLLSYTNTDRDNLDWTDAEKYVMDGKAAYQLMGDWEAGPTPRSTSWTARPRIS
jgi:glucose/mannose transport system substrate-binding protein